MNDRYRFLASRLRRLGQWVSRTVLAAGAQSAIALTGFISGIVIIRSLSPEQYAYYTIANSALGVMTMLADGGGGVGVMALGGQVWRDRAKLGMVIASGLALRRQFGLVVLLIAGPLTALLLQHQGASWPQVLIVTASMLPYFAATVSGQLLEVVPRLHQRLLPLQGTQIVSNVARLAIVLLVVPHWPRAAVALLCASLPQWWAVWRLRRIADESADWRTSQDSETRARLIAQVRRTMPAALYTAVSAQLTIWLAALFGVTNSVAAVGALGRFAMILGAVGGVFSVVAIPRFARIPAADKQLLRRRYWQLQVGVAAVCSIPFAALVIFPSQALAVLGPHYAGLEHEAVLMAASSVVGTVTGVAYTLGATRGVVAPPLLSLPYGLAGQASLVMLLPLDTVAGVIWVGLLSEASLWMLHTLYYFLHSRR